MYMFSSMQKPVELLSRKQRHPPLKKFRLFWHSLVHKLNYRKAVLLDSCEELFERLGYHVFDHPYRYIIISVSLCLLLGLCHLRRTVELDMEVLYALKSSPSQTARQELRKVFPTERTTYILAKSKTPGAILTRESLTELHDFWTKANQIKLPKSLADIAEKPGDPSPVSDWIEENQPSLFNKPTILRLPSPPPPNALRTVHSTPIELPTLSEHPPPPGMNVSIASEGDWVSLSSVCLRNGMGECRSMSVFDLYSTPSSWGAPIHTSRYPYFVNFRSANVLRVDSLVGGIEKRVSPTGRVTVLSASAASFRLDLDGGRELEKYSALWEQGLVSLIEHSKYKNVDLYVRAHRSVNDELATSSQLLGRDILTLGLATAFVTLFTVLINTSFHKVRSKWFVALVGVASTGLAYLSGVGLCYLLGLPHVPPSESTPFIVLGIGVDDVFVVVNAFAITSSHIKDARTRVALALRDSGISITITTLTNILAFVIGASSVYYAIRVFCIVTAAGLAAGYLLCITLVIAVLSLDARREQALCEDADTHQSGTLELTSAKAGEPKDKLATTTGFASTCASSPLEETPPPPLAPDATPDPPKSPNIKPTTPEPILYDSHGKIYDGVFAVEEHNNQLVIAERVEAAVRARSAARLGGRHFWFRRPSLWRPLAGAQPQEAKTPQRPWRLGKLQRWLKGREPVSVEEPTSREPSSSSSLELTWLSEGRELSNLSTKALPCFVVSQLGGSVSGAVAATTAEGACPFCAPSSDSSMAVESFELSQLPRFALTAESSQLRPFKMGSAHSVEPEGTVGKPVRKFFLNYYGPFLTGSGVKIATLVVFAAVLVAASFACFKVDSGLTVRELTPRASYLRSFYDVREEFFSAYGDECVVVFPGPDHWEKPEVQSRVLELIDKVRASPRVVLVLSGMEEFLRGGGSPRFESNFTSELKTWLTTTARGRLHATEFEIESGSRPRDPDKIKAWKFLYWMKYLDNTREAIRWLQEIQNFLSEFEGVGSSKGHVFTPMGILWESDPKIFPSTLSNVLVALLSMGLVASLLIPDFKSGLLVLMVIMMIDIDVYGSMPGWGLNLNMMTMVNLVLSIGFAVDYTAHITHCFNHCKGRTRNHRMIETLVSMGVPVTNGMISTYAAIASLSLSDKYILKVIFKMTTSVLVFAFLHGIVLMPVILSLVGPLAPREIDVVKVKRGELVSVLTLDAYTGKVLAHDKLTYQQIKRRQAIQKCLAPDPTISF